MKKQQRANLIMVLIIVLIAAIGVFAAVQLIAPEKTLFGSEYRITVIPDNRLVTDENTENLCTITIRCDTIFDNADKLDEAKAPYVPEDGD